MTLNIYCIAPIINIIGPKKKNRYQKNNFVAKKAMWIES